MTDTRDRHSSKKKSFPHSRGKSPGGPPGQYRPVVAFVIITIVSLVLFFLLLRTRWVQVHFGEPYTLFVASTSRLFLRMIGIDASGSGTTIASPDFSVNILYVCNGIEATAIFFATVLGFPSSWKNRLLGLAFGYPVIYFVNILRIAALFLIGYKVPRIFETVHYYYAQAFVILATICVWLVWVSKYSAYATKNRHQSAD